MSDNPAQIIPSYLERWEQALCVLDGLTPHERENHFNMGTWGRRTECGTNACLAGHCSLNPWFHAYPVKTHDH